MPDAETLHLVTVDYQNWMAFVATRWFEGGEEIVGVARYDVLGKTAPGAAEAALVVEDQFQDLGFGTHLMKHLICYAPTQRVQKSWFLVHESNYRFMRFLHHLGLLLESSRRYGPWEFRMGLDPKS